MLLVVEDEPALLRLVALVLAERGLEVRQARDAETALQMVASARPRLILSDIRLPGLSGTDLAARVKGDPSTASIPVLLMSAMREPRGHVADAFIAKPFDLEELDSLVGQFLAED